MGRVFITGATGYLCRATGAAMAARGDTVSGLVRTGSEGRLPPGVTVVVGNALDAATWQEAASGADTLVHLVGTPKPSPAKAEAFRSVDLVSIRTAAGVAWHAGVGHVVYVSVAHPAPVMRA